MRLRAFAIALYVATLGFTLSLHGQEHKVTLIGTIFEADPAQEECRFILDPEGDSESVSIVGTPQGYLCDYLRGSRNHHFIITLGPADR